MVLLILKHKFIPVKSGSKIGFFLFTTALVISMGSCSKARNDVIPDVNLTAIGSDTVDGKTNNWGNAAAGGFDGNGIIIYNGGDDFYAYDRTCPYDYEVNGLSVKVKIDFTIATCPKCGTIYSLSASGTPASGVGRYPLKNYRTSFDGRFLRVWNN
jgi:nitrite reductase/ring-hydroxylating ferredoxin subunit